MVLPTQSVLYAVQSPRLLNHQQLDHPLDTLTKIAEPKLETLASHDYTLVGGQVTQQTSLPVYQGAPRML